MKLSVKIAVSLALLVCLNSFGQSTLTNFKKGALIIPMDNSKQNLLSSQVAFNVKAYGLVNALLQNNVPVNWVIKDAKIKDEVDFSVLSSRMYPSTTAAVAIDYRSGPFVIDSLWAATALPIITAYGNNVAVYKAEVAFTAPVRYQLMFKPKIAVFTNGNNPLIHTKALRLAGFSSPAHFDSIPAQNFDANSCYTFGCEPHWSGGSSTVTSKVTAFLNSGGNFFAQCVGINAYEQFEHHHTTNGITYETASGSQENNNIYFGTDQPLMQFDGVLTNAPTGTIVNYKNDGGSYQAGTQFLVKKSTTPAHGAADGDVVLSTRKTGFALVGGNVTYLGGHDYLRGTFDLLDLGLLGLDYARASDVTWNNGLRIFYNAIFVPSTRPTACNFVFAGEARVVTTTSDVTPCLLDTLQYTITFTNLGSGTAHNVAVKTTPTPSGLNYVSNTADQGTFSTGTNTWTIGELSPNTTAQLTIRYKVVADGTYSLTAYSSNLIAGNSFAEDTSSLVIITNQTAPVVVAPPALNINTNAGCTATGVSLGSLSISDECGIVSSVNDAPTSFPLGTTTVTYTVTDNSGNVATATQLVTVTDNIAPVITAPANISITPSSGCSVTGIDLGTPVTSDNCGVASVTNNAPSSYPIGTTTVTWIVTDNAGNTATANQTVTVVDNQNPTIAAPLDITSTTNVGCFASGLNLGTPTTADNCTIVSVVNNAPSSFPVGVTIVTWTITDSAGNTATSNQTVTISDNQNPTITVPANIVTMTNSGCNATGLNLGTPTTFDNCGVASVTNDAPSSFPVGTTIITWTVTDNNGNTVSATQTVTVSDNQLPEITPPNTINATTNSDCTATGLNLGTPTTSDNCGIASVTNDAPTSFPLGTTTVVWTVTDNYGNTATANQTVTVTDNENPTITAPDDISVSTNSGCTATDLNLGTPLTSDNCGVASVTNDAPAVFAVGTTTVVWTITDNSGNTATASQLVIVSDDESPVIVAPDDINTTVDAQCEVTGLNIGTPLTSDNCGVASVTNDAPSSFPLGTTSITWTVTDNNGNTASATQNITVVDDQHPTITAPSAISVYPVVSCDTSGINLGTPVVDDNCGIASVTNDAPEVFAVGSTSVTWIVTDNSGNTASSIQIVTVIDDQDPVIIAPADLSISSNSGCVATGLNLGIPVTSDNCGVASVTNNAPTSFEIGTTVVVWSIEDNSGNTATAQQLVTVSDTEAPVISNCNDTIKSCVSLVEFVVPSAVDNCSLNSFTQIDNTGLTTGSNFPDGLTTLQYQAVDLAGNQSTCALVIKKVILPDSTSAGPNQTIYTDEATLDAVVTPVGSGRWEIVAGSGTFSNEFDPKTVVYGLEKGSSSFTWTTSNEGCFNAIDTVRITYVNINIPNGISPDGDNVNDFFEIKGIESFAPAKMVITNRWGQVVFESDNYTNNWGGTNRNGLDLTDDTYYYHLILSDESAFSGFVIVKRK